MNIIGGIGWRETLRPTFEKIMKASSRLDFSKEKDTFKNYKSRETRLAYIAFQNGYGLAVRHMREATEGD